MGNEIADITGPFYESDKLILNQWERDALFEMQTADGVWVCPTWQFSPSGLIRNDVHEVVEQFADCGFTAGWTIALWMRTDNPDLEGMTPLEWLNAGRDAERVEESARITAREWTRP